MVDQESWMKHESRRTQGTMKKTHGMAFLVEREWGSLLFSRTDSMLFTTDGGTGLVPVRRAGNELRHVLEVGKYSGRIN
jgi:hypothetical protein